MATYKAEFLSHYYKGRLRPRYAYAFGFINVWSRFAALAPGFVNLTTQLPLIKNLARFIAGIDSRREIPKFAPETFKTWFERRQPPTANRQPYPVLLWADTFNNNFHPTTAQAAVEVLEDAGFAVRVPRQPLCCGRPLYDYGFLDQAKRYLEQIMASLQAEIRAGVPIVVLEPSCCAVFRDELVGLFPHREDAKRLSEQTFTLAEFLEHEGYKPPQLKRKAILHGHCHHKAIMKLGSEESILRKMGLDLETPDTGCCGMAGAFGFESGEHYDVAIACGEQVLLPIARNAPKDTLIIADGFSCREQVSQATDRVPLHLAQVLQMALHDGEHGAPGDLPETRYVHPPRNVNDELKTALLVGATVWALAAGASWLIRRFRR